MLNQFYRFPVPPFLRRLDHFLMINYPMVAISRVHYVLLYGISCVFVSLPLRQFDYKGASMCFSLLSVVAGMWWLYHQLTNDPDDQFARHNPAHDLVRIGLYHLCLGVFFSLEFWTSYWLDRKPIFEGSIREGLLLVSLVTALLLMYQQSGLKLFALLIVTLMLGTLSEFTLVDVIWKLNWRGTPSTSLVLLPGLIFFFIYAIVCIQAMRVKQLEHFSVWVHLCTAVATVMSGALVVIVTETINDLLTIDKGILPLFARSPTPLLSQAVGYLLFVFVFRKIFLSLKSLPQKS